MSPIRNIYTICAYLRPFLFVPLVCLATMSCEAQVLGISRREAEKRLAAGTIDFIVNANVKRVADVSRIDPAAPFYAALLLNDLDAEVNAPKVKALLIEALKNSLVRGAAFDKLMEIDSEAGFLIFSRGIAGDDGTVWQRACRLYAVWMQLAEAGGAEPSAELIRFFLDEPLTKAHTWLWNKIAGALSKKEDESPPVAAYSLIEGRFSISKSDYGAAVRAFRAGFYEKRELFLTRPDLLSDLGRALQYGAPQDGQKLFLAWERALDKNASKEIRYRLLFFAGRMARQTRKTQEALSLFAEAAECAPNNEQKDACIWYLLDTAYGQKEENLIAAAKTWAERWHDASYFDDIFDKFGVWAAKKRRFDLIRNAFFAINGNASAEIYSRYAFICGRALESGFIQKRSATENAAFFYNLAYVGNSLSNSSSNKGGVPSFYYRALAAERLERKLDLDSVITDAAPELNTDSENQFFEGFFRFGAKKFAYYYIRAVRDNLSTAALRYLAIKLDASGEWHSAINLTLYYMKRDDYKLNRRDLELRFPRGHSELIEHYAKEAKLETALLYGLVRRESVFNAAARSRVGAAGLTQLMLKTGTEMARQIGIDVSSADFDLYDPKINLKLGSLYYRQLLNMTSQSSTLATLSYNGGIGRIRRWKRAEKDLSDDLFLETIELTETRNYGRGVLGDEVVYKWLWEL